MNITEDQLRDLRNALDLIDEDVRYDYSGRGMYGRTCLGFVVDATDIVVGVALHQALGDDAWEMARNACTDNMGRGAIVYFPGYSVAIDCDDPGPDCVKHEGRCD